MRMNENTRKMEVTCNMCGKKMAVKKGIVLEGLFSANIDWGYFSEKDGEVHQIDICENCYDEWISTFKVPINIVRKNEML